MDVGTVLIQDRHQLRNQGYGSVQCPRDPSPILPAQKPR
ncbi:Uncharacterised protein [Vibrio cholerae]|nr:Uncharacterised protein [Vibrio cholerae]CSI16345.1 Uncharacterised protein [Vibrio cholerae]